MVGLPAGGPRPGRLLVLAADAAAMRHEDDDVSFERIAPGFALHTDFPGAEELARRSPTSCPA